MNYGSRNVPELRGIGMPRYLIGTPFLCSCKTLERYPATTRHSRAALAHPHMYLYMYIHIYMCIYIYI